MDVSTGRQCCLSSAAVVCGVTSDAPALARETPASRYRAGGLARPTADAASTTTGLWHSTRSRLAGGRTGRRRICGSKGQDLRGHQLRVVEHGGVAAVRQLAELRVRQFREEALGMLPREQAIAHGIQNQGRQLTRSNPSSRANVPSGSVLAARCAGASQYANSTTSRSASSAGMRPDLRTRPRAAAVFPGVCGRRDAPAAGGFALSGDRAGTFWRRPALRRA